MPPAQSASWAPIIVAAIGGIMCGAGGGLLTRIDDWYRNLRKPVWQPPDWLFGPVWTVIITLSAWSAVLGWRHAGAERTGVLIAALFAVNVALNIAWSYLFFFTRRPDRALREVVALWLSIAALIAAMSGISSLGAWLLVPYLLWVSFAAYLNLTIVRLNGAFA